MYTFNNKLVYKDLHPQSNKVHPDRIYDTAEDAEFDHRQILIILLEQRLDNWLPYLDFTKKEAELGLKLLKAGVDLCCPKLAKVMSMYPNLEYKSDVELGLVVEQEEEEEEEKGTLSTKSWLKVMPLIRCP